MPNNKKDINLSWQKAEESYSWNTLLFENGLDLEGTPSIAGEKLRFWSLGAEVDSKHQVNVKFEPVFFSKEKHSYQNNDDILHLSFRGEGGQKARSILTESLQGRLLVAFTGTLDGRPINPILIRQNPATGHYESMKVEHKAKGFFDRFADWFKDLFSSKEAIQQRKEKELDTKMSNRYAAMALDTLQAGIDLQGALQGKGLSQANETDKIGLAMERFQKQQKVLEGLSMTKNGPGEKNTASRVAAAMVLEMVHLEPRILSQPQKFHGLVKAIEQLPLVIETAEKNNVDEFLQKMSDPAQRDAMCQDVMSDYVALSKYMKEGEPQNTAQQNMQRENQLPDEQISQLAPSDNNEPQIDM